MQAASPAWHAKSFYPNAFTTSADPIVRSSDLTAPPLRQLITTVEFTHTRCRFRRKTAHILLQTRQRRPNCDPEHSLPACQKIDNLVAGRALIDPDTIGNQRQTNKIPHSATPQRFHRRTNIHQRYPGIQQPLDHPQNQQIAKAVQTTLPEPAALAIDGSTKPVRAQ